MATAVQDKRAPGPSARPEPDAAARRGILPVYKPGEGTVTRLGLFVVLAAFVLYTAHHWFYSWSFLRNTLLKYLEYVGLGVLLNWTLDPGPQRFLALTGAGVVVGGGLLLCYYYLYVRPRSAEFLVQTDSELRKVTWPKISPWFKMETQVWGATYVVLIVVVLLALYVFGVDTILNFCAQWIFYRE
jgi:preprotein translocase SecE subunit